MTDTFAIREVNSDEDVLQVPGSKKQQLWRRGLNLWVERGPRRIPRLTNVKLHEMMDFYVFCSTFLLWSTAIVLTIFSVYILLEQYGVAIMVELDLFTYAMVLQVLAALVNLLAAALTTSLIRLDTYVLRRAVFGGVAVLTMLSLLTAVSMVGAFGKREIRGHDMHELRVNHDKVPSGLSEEAKGMGTKCEVWQDKGCWSVYKRHVIIYTNYLIGSALVGVAIDVCVLPVYIFVYIVIRRDLQQEGLITSDSSRRVSFLPVKDSLANGEGFREESFTNLDEPIPGNSSSHPYNELGKTPSLSARISEDGVK